MFVPYLQGSGGPLSFDDIKRVASEFVKKFKLVGRHREMHQLDFHLGSSLAALQRRRRDVLGILKVRRTPQVISVWGIAGVGKSALVRTLYYNEILSASKFDQYSWVDVPHPFSVAEFSRRLHWYSRYKTAFYSLIVVDGLRSAEEWDLIRTSLLVNTTYTVIVITDDESVARHCCVDEDDEDAVLNIKCLEAGTDLDLFKVYLLSCTSFCLDVPVY
jgi:hypothetical protein